MKTPDIHRGILACALAAVCLPSCAKKEQGVVKEEAGVSKEEPGVLKREGKPDFIRAFDEARMDAAIAEARSTLGSFVEALAKPSEGSTNYAIKKGYPYGEKDDKEFLWISGVRADGDGFVGKIGNDPVHSIGVKLGDEVKVPKDEVVDWMYVENKKLRGGYTIVALAYGTERQDTLGKQLGVDWSRYEFLKKTEKPK